MSALCKAVLWIDLCITVD